MICIPNSDKKRIVIVGCGFAGLKLARKLRHSNYQVVIIDKNNYHQFQPLFYQVASAGLEASSIAFPLRKIFHDFKDFYIRKAEVIKIDAANNQLITSLGAINYDYLVLSQGVRTAYFGLDHLEHITKSMKSVSEALDIRNSIFQNFEDALTISDIDECNQFMNIVVVGGGPAGVEISGVLAEMRKYILHKDFPELDCTKINIYIIERNQRILAQMSPKASEKATQYLESFGVKILTSQSVKDYDGEYVYTGTDEKIKTNIVLWTAGTKGVKIEGLKSECYLPNLRITVDRYSRVSGHENIFAIGDIASMSEEKYPNGHPQVSQVAIQQGVMLAKNFQNMSDEKPLKMFSYKNLGSMATIGRNLAVVELPHYRFYGPFAWFVWMFVHIMAIVGIKNRLLIFINWMWSYLTYDQSLRLIIKPKGTN